MTISENIKKANGDAEESQYNAMQVSRQALENIVRLRAMKKKKLGSWYESSTLQGTG
jgi:hypothetical protein